jgi:hypothetical protein
VEKYGRGRQATDDNIGVIWRMRFACHINKERVQYLLLFQGNNGYTSAP